MYKKYSGEKNTFRGVFSEHHHIFKRSHHYDITTYCQILYRTNLAYMWKMHRYA